MATKFNLNRALENGVVNVYELDAKDQFVMVIILADKEYVVPMIKNVEGAMAYISEDLSVTEYNKISKIITEVVGSKIYPGFAFVAYRGEAPEHEAHVRTYYKVSTATVGGKKVTVNKGEGADKALSKAGYILPKTDMTICTFGKRDYSELMSSNPEAQERYKEMADELEKAEATYDGLSNEIRVAHEGMMNGFYDGIIFTGPTGTGKSWAARICAVHDKAPLLNLQITYGTTIEDLVGTFIPNDKSADTSAVEMEIHRLYKELSELPKLTGETKEGYASRFAAKEKEVSKQVSDLISSSGGSAKWRFVPGPLLKGSYEGWQIVLEEVNYGQAGVNAKINEYTDGTPRVTVNGISYKKHPNFVVYMTMNPGYEGTEPLNIALKNRFAIVDVPALTKDEYCKRSIADSRSKGHALCKEFYSKLYSFAGFLEKESTTSKWHENVKYSFRNAQRLNGCIVTHPCSYQEFRDAIFVNFVNALSCDNDNSKALQEFKGSADLDKLIKDMYDLYDFAVFKELKVTVTMDDLFEEDVSHTYDSDSSSDSVKDAKAKLVDDLFGGLSH